MKKGVDNGMKSDYNIESTISDDAEEMERMGERQTQGQLPSGAKDQVEDVAQCPAQSREKANKYLNYLMGETQAVYHEIALKLGLTDSALQILYALSENDGCCSLQELCRASGLSKQTVHSALRKLEQEGTVALAPQKAGAKCKVVTLTPTGRSLADATTGRLIAAEQEILGGWPPQELALYLALNERFLNELKQKAETL